MTSPENSRKRPSIHLPLSDQSPTKKSCGPNWVIDDDLSLLLLINKWDQDWEIIKREFHLHQHRRPNETMKTLEK